MTTLAWQQGGASDGPAVVLCHDWAGSAGAWEASGWVAGLGAAGFSVLAPDLPGHADSAAIGIPAGAEPAAWTAAAMAADLESLGIGRFGVVGCAAGALVAGHLVARSVDRATGLVLVGCDDGAVLEHASEVAGALRDPRARLWNTAASASVAAARADRRHHLSTLADWADRMAWPAAPRLGSLRTPVLLAVGTEDPRRERTPRLAALFHDGHLVTIPGDRETALRSHDLIQAAAAFLSDG